MAERGRIVGLVPAAGGGRRFGGDAPKQYALLAGRALLACTLDRLAAALSPLPVVVALAQDDMYYDAVIGARVTGWTGWQFGAAGPPFGRGRS